MRRVPVLLAVALLLLTFVHTTHAGPKKDGPGFQISAGTTGYTLFPSVAQMPDGGFVVIWTDFGSPGVQVMGRIVDGAGEPMGPEFEVSAYTTTTGEIFFPDVAVDDEGDFVVAWLETDQYSPYGNILARQFDSSGSPEDPEFVVNSYSLVFGYGPPSYLARASVASEPDGDFVVVWNNMDANASPVLVRQFDSSGTPGSEIFVGSYGTGTYGLTPDITMNGAGDFLVVWSEFYGPGGEWNVLGRRFDSAGQDLDPAPFQIKSSTTIYSFFPSVDVRDDGDFVVVWQEFGYKANRIRGRRVDSDGTPNGSAFQVVGFTTYGGGGPFDKVPKVSMNGMGDFVVAWGDPEYKDGSSSAVFARRFDRAARKIDKPPFLVNSYTYGPQFLPDVRMEDDGGVFVVWAGLGDYGMGISGQKFRKAGTCGDFDRDGDGLGDGCDILITVPSQGTTADCSPAGRPTIRWRKGRYDYFRAMIAWSSSFDENMRVTSGSSLTADRTWTPTARQWRKACEGAGSGGFKVAAGSLYIRVFGINTDVKKEHPQRRTFSNTIKMYMPI